MTDQITPTPSPRQVPAGYVLVTVVVALGVALLLNATLLEQGAKAQAPGWSRTVSLALIEPIAGVARFLGLDRPSAKRSTAPSVDSPPRLPRKRW